MPVKETIEAVKAMIAKYEGVMASLREIFTSDDDKIDAEEQQKLDTVQSYIDAIKKKIGLGGEEDSSDNDNTTTTPQLEGNYPIKDSVGDNGGTNDKKDVVTVQRLLKKKGYSKIVVTGTFDDATKAAIYDYQRSKMNNKNADGRIDEGGSTWFHILTGKKASYGDKRVLRVEEHSVHIEKAAAKYGMEVSHLKAIMAVESGGDPDASSGAAFGLMQVTRSTWAGIQKRYPELSKYDFESYWRDPEINTMFGAAVLKSKAKSMGVSTDDPNFTVLAVTAYNAGQGTVKWAIENAKKGGSKQPTVDFVKPEFMKPAIERGGIYKYYLEGKGKSRNKSGTKEEAINLKYKEVSGYGPKMRDYLQKQEDLKETIDTINGIGGNVDTPTNNDNPPSDDTNNAPTDNGTTDNTNTNDDNATDTNTGGSGKYVVVSGDNGYKIAAKLGVDFSALSAANPSVDWRKLKVGQELNNPKGGGNANGGGKYTVVSGDNGYKIASKLGVEFSALSAANEGVVWNKLSIGQELNIPSGGSNPSSGGDTTSNGSDVGDSDKNEEYTATSTWDTKYTDKRIGTLTPETQKIAFGFINAAHKELGIKLRVTSGKRTIAEQDALFKKGGVTQARGGQSYHNYGLAIDVVEIKDGKALWANPNWGKIGAMGKRFGFEWGGDWKGFVDKPHFQLNKGTVRELCIKHYPARAKELGYL